MLKLRFESLLERALETSSSTISVHGSASSIPAAIALAHFNPTLSEYTHLVVVSNDTAGADFVQNLQFFNPSIRAPILSGYDVSPYSGLFPNSRSVAARVGWLHRAQVAAPNDILVGTVAGLHQRTLPRIALSARTTKYTKGSEIRRELSQQLLDIGYQEVPRTEDLGQFSFRGGILDVYSPAHDLPVRVELFGDFVESLRFFDPETQRSTEPTSLLTIVPAREAIYEEDRRQSIAQKFAESMKGRDIDGREGESLLHDISLGRYFSSGEFLLPYFYDSLASPASFFSRPHLVWVIDQMACVREHDLFVRGLRDEHVANHGAVIHPPVEDLIESTFLTNLGSGARTVTGFGLHIDAAPGEGTGPDSFDYSSASTAEFRNSVKGKTDKGEDFVAEASARIARYRENGNTVVITTHTQSQAQRLSYLLERGNLHPKVLGAFDLEGLVHDQSQNESLVHIISTPLSESVRLTEENLVFLSEEDFFSKSESRREKRKAAAPVEVAELDFGDIKAGDYIVHIQNGVGIFDGLKVMSVQGIEAEFIQLTYKDNDRLYLPIYRVGQIQKFSGIPTLDKLGGSNWQKTKIKVRSHLRDVASELLELYAKRSQIKRPPFAEPSAEYRKFEALFAYDETADQLKAIDDVWGDLESDHPMDRLVCGDVGFGKTEVALRASFALAAAGKQVAILVPTTVLAFQHLETFKNRFKGSPFQIASFSRFTSKTELKKNLELLKEGKVQVAIGTHRLLSKDVAFKDLGLLIVDEEQKFGVTHKEKIKKLKSEVDTLTLSATPIPRTLNMSLVGIRDLSLINTAPRDRLPIRTFVCKFDAETVRKAILSEIQRGGQVFYIHNRVQSIHGLADELRALVPEARIRVGHGQMAEGELEETMVAFFKHEFDVLLCTTIIESGMDVSRANTMVVDRADTFGLSQLYQLRGRIGRSKERAYCYLLIPKTGLLDPEAQERLKILQENTTLGSGFRIAHHDLELRGAGNILGEAQSGHINAVGYELYLELLQEALSQARGEVPDDKEVEPDINLRIPALIPDAYIPDIRIRLGFYKQLSNIKQIDDLDRIESDLRDQFGAPPEQVMNLLGVMLIRRLCKDLGVRDISSGTKSLSLAFTEKTRVEPRVIVDLALREKKRYTITPDNRLIIRVETKGWPEIYEELVKLKKLAHLL